MKMRHRKKRTINRTHNPGKFISSEDLNRRITDLKMLIARRWLEGTAETIAQEIARVRANLDYPRVKDE